jgi:hypothetical protein
MTLTSRFAVGTALLCQIVFAAPARAEPSANELLRDYTASDLSGRQAFEETLRATENGMGWFSARAKVKLYCQPKNSPVLTGSTIMDILQRQIAEVPSIGFQPYGLAVLLALKRAFPCKSGVFR